MTEESEVVENEVVGRERREREKRSKAKWSPGSSLMAAGVGERCSTNSARQRATTDNNGANTAVS